MFPQPETNSLHNAKPAESRSIRIRLGELYPIKLALPSKFAYTFDSFPSLPRCRKAALYTPHDLNPKKDHDALFVLALSLLAMPLTLGLFYAGLLGVVIYKAARTPAITTYRSATYLVFGKKLRRNQPDVEYRARLDRLLQCGFQNAILMGGQTGGSVSEAQAGCDYLLARGLDRQCVHLETDSQNTLENLKNARQLLTRQNTVIISNRYHLARCSALASSLGIEHQLCAAENSFSCNPENLFKCLLETFYLHWFYSGKGWALLTRNHRMLNKLS